MKKKIIFFGTPEHSARLLRSFITDDRFEVGGVVSNPDRPVGRKNILTPCPVKILAEEKKIPVLTPENFSGEEEAWLKNKNADFFVIVAYGTLIPQSIIDIPNIGTFNLHFSLLPKYRGASPVQAAILNGDEKNTGISIFQLVEKMDAGDVFYQENVDISGENFGEAIEKMTEKGSNAFINLCANFEKFSGVSQDQSQATFCGKFSKADGEIFLEKDSAEEILRKFRAFFLWPGIFFFDEEGKRVKIIDIKQVDIDKEEGEEKEAGEFFLEKFHKKVFLKTVCGILEIKKVQKEGKKEITGRDFFAQKN